MLVGSPLRETPAEHLAPNTAVDLSFAFEFLSAPDLQ